MTSNADRQRRYRWHKAGNHELCAEDRECRVGWSPAAPGDTPGELVPGEVDRPEPIDATPARSFAPRRDRPASPRDVPFVETLDARGQALWRELQGDELDPLPRALLEEACRLADRLDRLDAALTGHTIFGIAYTDDEHEVVLTVDNALTAARLHAGTLKALVAEIKTATAGAAPTPGRTPATPETDRQSGGNLASISAARAARRARASGL